MIFPDAYRKRFFNERLITFLIVAGLILASTILLLRFTSPELSWDEGDYGASAGIRWGVLWGRDDYNRHLHGPMSIYLAKLGQDMLPVWAGSIENRLRFFAALVGSLGIGFLYWALRRCFGTSRCGALVGSGLLLLSFIRLDETNVIGPHHLMLVCTIGVFALGYYWRDRPTLAAAVGLGAVLGFGALSMTYVIPVAVGWIAAVTLAGGRWVYWERMRPRVSWWLAVVPLMAVLIVLALWPPGILQGAIWTDFLFYRNNASHPTLVGSHIYEVTPKWSVIFWMARCELPLLVCSALVISAALLRSLRQWRVTSKQVYLLVSMGFFLAVMVVSNISGARNLLQFVGVLCLATGALFDEALGNRPRMARILAGAVLVLAAGHLLWLSRSSHYTPYLATDGYQAFLRGNKDRLRENAQALVYGTPVLTFYEQSETPISWNAREMLWTTHPYAVPEDIKYVLMPAFVCNDMPPDQPMRSVVTAHWKEVWSYKVDGAWELRLYERP